MNSRSTHVVVGLCGNEIRMMRGDRPLAIQILERIEERRRVRHGQRAGMAFRHDHAVLMDRIRRIRRGHNIARPDDGEQQMRQRVLRAHGDDGFGIGIQVRRRNSWRTVSRSPARRLRNAFGQRIAMIARVARGLHQFLDDDVGGRRRPDCPSPNPPRPCCAARAFAFISLMTAKT